MNLVDAAIEILRARPGEALSVEELVRLASEQGLLDKPPTPASMKGRLATELKKGESSRLERVDGDLWRLREAGAATPEPAAGDEDVDEDDLDDDEDLDEDDDLDEDEDEDLGEDEEDEDLDDDGDEDEEDEDLDEDEDFDEDEVTGDFDEPERGAADENVAEAVAEELEELAEPQPPEEPLEAEPELEPEPIPELPVPELEPGMEEILTPPVRLPARRGEAAEPAEEQALALYAEETESGAPLAAREYRDERTADEDRPMLPEISSGRRDRDRGRNRRDERRREREERRKARDARRGRSRGEEGAAPAGEAAAAAAAPVEAGPPAADDLAAAAAYTLQQLRDTQPVQVKQLAQMMRKRKLLTGDPERVWPHLRAALLHDERAHRSRGLRPRVVGRGRDLFALPGGRLDPGLAEAEEAVARAARALEAATRRTFAERLARLALPGLEQVANIWLIQAGYTDIDWIKRVDRSSYATARAPDLGNVLVGVRSGDQPVDRRGVGELRAGVAAKGLAAGVLLSGRPLSSEALAELEKGGKPVLALCGDALVTALLAARVGVQTAAVPVSYLDVDFFEELARG